MLKTHRLSLFIGCFTAGLVESFALPTLVFQPADTTVELGGSATISIRYPRGTTPSVQWQLNGNDVPGETMADLVIADADFSDAGIYTAVLRDDDGSITSNEAMLNILGPIDPPFDPDLQLTTDSGTLSGTWNGAGDFEEAPSPDGPWAPAASANSTADLGTPTTPAYYRLQNPFYRPTNVFIPTSYEASVPMPLVIVLHGYSGNPAGVTGYLGVGAMAEERGFLFCAPPGTQEDSPATRTFWNATAACCNFYNSQVDDVAYLTSLIMEIQRHWNVDPKRIHILAESNGGNMAYRMAQEEASLIASIATLAGVTEYDPDLRRPSEPVHVLQIHGTADALITYGGGSVIDPSGNLPAQQLLHPGATGSIAIWADYNGNENQTTESTPSLDLDLNVPGLDTKVTRYTSNPPGGSVELWTIEGGGHTPNLGSGANSSQFSEKVIDWLLAHPKP